MAARRAKLVQHSSFLGLQGNPDACHPRRGSACSVSADRAGGNARPVFALPVQPTAAMSPRLGGAPGEHPRPLLSPHFFGKKWGPRPGGPGNGFPHEILTDISKTGCRRRRASSVMSG